MPELVRESPTVEMQPIADVPRALHAWIGRNRDIIRRLLRRSTGDVPLKINEAAKDACGLDHQWVRIGQQSPHAIRSGEKILAVLDMAEPALDAEEEIAEEEAPYVAA